MKTIQYKYPFLQERINVLTNKNYIALQIGIHKPWITPLSEQNNFTIPVIINRHEYSLTDKNILEFSNLYLRQLEIIIQNKNDPYLIIDIAYKTAD